MTRRLVYRVSFFFTNGESVSFVLKSPEDMTASALGWTITTEHENGKDKVLVRAEAVCYVRNMEFYVEELTEAEKLAKARREEEGGLFR